MTSPTPIIWGNSALRLTITHGPDEPPRIASLLAGDAAQGSAATASVLPVVEIALAGDGRDGTAGKRHVDGAAAQRLRLNRCDQGERNGSPWLQLEMADGWSGLRVTMHYELPGDGPVLRSWAALTAGEATPVVVEYVSSLALGGIGHDRRWDEEFTLWQCANPWSGEFRWLHASLAEHGLIDVGMTRYGQVGSKNRCAVTSVGAWSTAEHLPMGVLEDAATGRLVAWQVEHNGGWHWEIGDRHGGLYVTASGPTDQEHQCAIALQPGETFTTAPAAMSVIPGPPAGSQAPATARLGAAFTEYRRAIRRPHTDHVRLPIVYNDFLNALMSDPTTERELPLIDAAGRLGAEVYCIDAGWYDDEGGGWWDAVGEWRPSTKRFPRGGLHAVTDRIKAAGMLPGLWLEPEVVGRRSPLADRLPPEAFFRRHGERVLEWGRYQLDLRHPAARSHLDEVVDRLVTDFDLAYLKLDYNIDIGAGTTDSGRGLLEHNRAYLDWVASVLDRYPNLVIEGCAAGGSRTDGATGAVFPIQSLTDQQDFRLMPPIAAAAPLAIPPEQAGVWASVDGSMTPDEVAFSLISAMLSRVHLAGRIDTLDSRQEAVVREALLAYRDIRAHIAHAVPVWPLGLPGWRDDWVAHGLRHDDELLLAVHRRDGRPTISLPLGGDATSALTVDVVFPRSGSERAVFRVGDEGVVLDLTLPHPYSARLLRIRHA